MSRQPRVCLGENLFHLDRPARTLGHLEYDVDDGREIGGLSVAQGRLEANLSRSVHGRFIQSMSQTLNYPHDS